MEDPGVDGRIILTRIFRKSKGGMDWINLAQDRDRWQRCGECGNELSGSIQFGEFLD
jgi:ribosomal protein L34E